jgi:hypothetical protein
VLELAVLLLVTGTQIFMIQRFFKGGRIKLSPLGV